MEVQNKPESKAATSATMQRVESMLEGSVDDINAIDEAVLNAQGHQAAMPRQFSMVSALGLAFRYAT